MNPHSLNVTTSYHPELTVLISTNVPIVDKAGCTTIGYSFGTFGWLASPAYCIYNSVCRLRRYLYHIMVAGFAGIVVRYSKMYLGHLHDLFSKIPHSLNGQGGGYCQQVKNAQSDNYSRASIYSCTGLIMLCAGFAGVPAPPVFISCACTRCYCR